MMNKTDIPRKYLRQAELCAPQKFCGEFLREVFTVIIFECGNAIPFWCEVSYMREVDAVVNFFKNTDILCVGYAA